MKLFDDEDINSLPVESWLEQHLELRNSIQKTIKQDLRVLETNPRARYATLRRRIPRIAVVLGEKNEPGLLSDDIQRLIDPDTNDRSFDEQIASISSPVAKQEQPGVISSLWNLIPSFGLKSKSSSKPSNAWEKPLTWNTIPVLPQQDDIAFAEGLEALVKENNVYKSMVDDVKLLMIELLRQKIKRLASSIPPKVKEALVSSANQEIGRFYEQRKQQEELGAWSSLRERVQECLLKSAPQINNGYAHLLMQYWETNRRQHHT